MPKRSRVYQKRARFYGDFRDLGGGQEALIPKGDSRATRDPDVAAKLVTARVEELETRKRNRALLGVERDAPLPVLSGALGGESEGRASHERMAERDGEARSGPALPAGAAPPGAPVPLRSHRNVPADGGTPEGSFGAHCGRPLLRPGDGDITPERIPPLEDEDEPSGGPSLPPASGDPPGARLRTRQGVRTPLPFPDWERHGERSQKGIGRRW